MSSLFAQSRRALLFLLSVLLSALPLAAQLDPRLQANATSFLNLYQQADSIKAKPEIVTIFDFSRSMASLMFHPLYRNGDINDADDYRFMKFALTDETTSAPTNPANKYRIRAVANNCTSARADWIVTVTAGGATWTRTNPNAVACPATAGGGSASAYQIRASASACSAANAYINITPTSPTTAHTTYVLGTNANTGKQCTGAFYPNYTMVNSGGSTSGQTVEVSASAGGASGPWAPGTVLTLTVYMDHPMSEGEPASNKNISWNGGTLVSFTEVIPNQRYKSVITYTVPDFVPTAPTPDRSTQLAPLTPAPATFATADSGTVNSGDTLTFSTYFIQNLSGSTTLNWSVTNVDAGGTGYTCGAPPNPTKVLSTGAIGAGNLNTATWKVPAHCTTIVPGGVTSVAYVTASLDASPGSAYSYITANPTWTNLGTLSATTKDAAGYEALRKPDGSAVTPADAAAASAASGLFGAGAGKLDVRNWIRAASHVRFKKTIGSDVRTIDIPIPWKIIDPVSTNTGNPLNSLKVLDQLVKTTTLPDGTTSTTTYGSGTQIEMDLNYKVNGTTATLPNVFVGVSGSVPSGINLPDSSPTPQKNAFIWTIAYRPAYVAWLFNGKWQGTNPALDYYNASYTATTPYIVFDAASAGANKTMDQGSAKVQWGQAFGPSGTSWGTIHVPTFNGDGTYKSTTTAEASSYKVPAVSRAQATKQAAIQTWIQHQHEVWWAFRCLDQTTEAGGGTGTSINPNSATTFNTSAAANPSTTHIEGADSAWTVLNNTAAQGITAANGNSVNGMARIAGLFANGQTPLTYAMARTLAQYNDVSNVFNAVIGSDVSQCASHYLLLFTDGVDNNGIAGVNNPNTDTPYITGSGASATLTTLDGNQAILASPDRIDRGGTNWNLFTFAGIGAHLSDTSYGAGNFMAQPASVPASGNPKDYLPLSINKRSGIPYEKDHRVTTMTVGVSLGGQYTDASSPKRSLFLAAVVGDPSTKTGDLSSFHSFNGWDQPLGEPIDPNNDWIPEPTDPLSYPAVGKRKAGAVYFFDATDVAKLSASMNYAFKLAIGTAGNNATASPNLPFTGASFGKQTYIGTFQPPKSGGPIWGGDLLMFGTRETAGVVKIIDKSGNEASSLDSASAQWSTSDMLKAKAWASRTLLTRLPKATALSVFSDQGAAYTDPTTGLKNFVAQQPANPLAPGSAEQLYVIQKAMGGNATNGTTRPADADNRQDIMGDIINSSPSALEFNYSDYESDLPASLKAVGGNRFRLILVGTNQGWLHGFGEVTKVTTVTDGYGVVQEIVTGAVDELWAFMPTDFLPYLNDVYGMSTAGKQHQFMVDGTPGIYHLDLPPGTGGSANGVVDKSGNERALAIVGLRKGGRSYYALDLKNPFKPELKWSVVPDEADSFPNINLSTMGDAALKTLVANMGYSTCTPGIGRVAFTKNGSTVPTLRDAVFIGGGDSNQTVEKKFLDGTGKTIPLGRSLLALDVNSGEVLAAVDMTAVPGVTTTLGPPATPSTCSVGPIPAGVIPFEFILNSGMAQRAYFMDFNGGLWCWGSKEVADPSVDASLTAYKNYRVDNSDLGKWTTTGKVGATVGIRRVFQDGSGSNNALYTSLPAPFRVGSFSAPGYDGQPTPVAVGIAMVSGNRTNPLDYYPTDNPLAKPTQHRLTVVFDRQDSRNWGLDDASGADTGIGDGDLRDFTDNTVATNPEKPCETNIWKDITPGCDSYYLGPKDSSGKATQPKFGYYVNFPSVGPKYIAKGINSPMVVAGALFYSYFNPTAADPCAGGTGITYSNLISDAVNPITQDDRTGIYNPSGSKSRVSWSGVASEFVAFGTRGVLQGGTVPKANPTPGGVQTTVEMKTMLGNPKERFPKPRVWRTVR